MVTVVQPIPSTIYLPVLKGLVEMVAMVVMVAMTAMAVTVLQEAVVAMVETVVAAVMVEISAFKSMEQNLFRTTLFPPYTFNLFLEMVGKKAYEAILVIKVVQDMLVQLVRVAPQALEETVPKQALLVLPAILDAPVLLVI